MTADGIAVLDHDGMVRAGLRRRPICEVARAALPSHIPSLAELYDECGTGFELSLDVKDPAAAPAVVAVARDAGAVGRLWLCHPSWEQAATWRRLDDGVRLVDSTRIRRIKEGPERRAASLSAAGVDAVNLHASDWTMGLATLFHRFDRHCFGWDAQLERILGELLGFGLDGVYSDHVARMMAAVELASR